MSIWRVHGRPWAMALAILALLLGACGGGGGGDGAGAPPEEGAALSGHVSTSGGLELGKSAFPGGQQLRKLAARPPCRCGEVVVWFASAATPQDVLRDARNALGPEVELGPMLTDTGPAVLRGLGGDESDVQRYVDIVAALPCTTHAEPHYTARIADLPSANRPNDPVTLAYPWSFDLIRTSGAWQYTRGSSSLVVAVLDTGVGIEGNPHPDLSGRLVAGYDFVDDDTNAATPAGGHLHGTHVAGTICAVASNGIGVAGIAPEVRVSPVRVLGLAGSGSQMDIARGILWAAGLPVPGAPSNPNPARVLNLSLGSRLPSQLEQDAIADANQAGALVVAAAGNDSTAVAFPAAFPETLCVSSVGPGATHSPFSNFGPEVEVAAPGGAGCGCAAGDVWSTYYEVSGATVTPSYYRKAGTSMACPHVAAVAALVLSANPALTPTDVRSVLSMTAVDLGTPGQDSVFGHGLVDAQAAVERALALAGSPPSASAQLGTRTPRVVLSEQENSFMALLSNQGGGSLAVTGTTAMELTNTGTGPAPAWLMLSLESSTASSGQDALLRLTANVGIAGSSPRQAVVDVTSTAGSVRLTVEYRPGTPLDIGPVTVSLRDTDLGLVVDAVVATASNGYAFQFTGLDAGSYDLLIDSDGTSDGKPVRAQHWAGRFPTPDLGSVILADGQVRSGIVVPIAQGAEKIRPGTGGGPRTDTLVTRVVDRRSGVPLAGALISIGSGGISQLTDSRGVAVLPASSGPLTVTAHSTGFDAETVVNTTASEVGFAIAPSSVDALSGTTISVGVGGLAPGETAHVFVGGSYETNSPANFDSNGDMVLDMALTTVRVDAEAIVTAFVKDALQSTVRFGHGLVDRETLQDAQPAVEITASAFPPGTTWTGDAISSDLSFDGFYVLPLIPGQSLESSIPVGFDLYDTGALVTPIITGPPEWNALPVANLVYGFDVDTGRTSLRILRTTAGAMPGAYELVPLEPPPYLSTPASASSYTAGQPLVWTGPPNSSVNYLTIERDADGFQWRLQVPSALTSLTPPALGLLTSGTYRWSIQTVDGLAIDFENTSALPGDLASGVGVLDTSTTTGEFTFTVP